MKKEKKTHRGPLTLRERIDIEQMYCYGVSISGIARKLSRNKSTISREIGGKPRTGVGRYRADVAHGKAYERIKKRGNVRKLDKNGKLKEYVVDKIQLGWSPEQVEIRLPIDYPKDDGMRISYEAIYEWIYDQIYRKGNGDVKKGCVDLRMYLPQRHKRRAKKGFRKAQKAERETSLPSIEKRPTIVDERTRVGDWEDDTMVSRQSLARIKSINERKTGVVFFSKVESGNASVCNSAVIERLREVPKEYRHTLTRDRGTENREFDVIERELDMEVFFAHPHCSYERGSNENLNGLFRRYFPKKTDFVKITNEEIAKVEYLINTRPRKRFGGLTPAEMFYQETGVALFS